MDIEYIDDKIISQCAGGENIIEKFIAYSRGGTALRRYFGVPLNYAKTSINADFENSVKIQGNHVDVHYNKPITERSLHVGFAGSRSGAFHFPIPNVIYKTDKHIIIAPNKAQLDMSKTILCIAAAVISFILLIFLITSFILTSIFFIEFVIFACPIIYFYLFFVKKSYILVGPVESMSRKNATTINIKGRFETGVKSFYSADYDIDFYVGEK